MSVVEEITKRALALDVKERVQLAESLLSSLPSPAAWSTDELVEAERRDREIEFGQTRPIKDGEFWQRVEARRPKVKVEYHPQVESDVADALKRYDDISQILGEEFKAELKRLINLAATKPVDFILLSPSFGRQISENFPTISCIVRLLMGFAS